MSSRKQPTLKANHQTSDSSDQLIVSSLLTWFCANARDLPWRRTSDPYGIWVSEIMLQQTQVKTVIPFWERWMRELPTIQSLADAHSDKIHKLWEGLGYYTRVRNMQRAAQIIVSAFGGKFPETFEQVHELTGIGRYTAGAICSIAFNQPTPILDGNVIRVLTRVYGIAGNPRDKQVNADLWQGADALVRIASQTTFVPKIPPTFFKGRSHPIPSCSFFNQSLMELGALVCTPRQPACESCPLCTNCTALRESRVPELPNLGERAAATKRKITAYVVERAGKFLVRQRPAGVVNANLWEFPTFEKNAEIETDAKFSKLEKKPFCRINHSITRYRIQLDAFRANLATENECTGRWHSITEMEKLAFPSAHRKILDVLINSSKREA